MESSFKSLIFTPLRESIVLMAVLFCVKGNYGKR
nr:MAG TPA: hypothetical protein [Bacteriophage sp.]